jgi:hypothetical protein
MFVQHRDVDGEMTELGIVPRPAPNATLDDEHIDRLPPVFKEIIRHDREIGDYFTKPIVRLDVAQNMLERADELTRHARRVIERYKEGW